MRTSAAGFLVLVLLGLGLVHSEITPNFPPTQPITVTSGSVGSNIITGSVLPCNFDYYEIQEVTDVQPGDYFQVVFSQTADPLHIGDAGTLYLLHTETPNLQEMLATNSSLDTLGGLPGPENYDYACNEASCTIELNCNYQNGSYYIAIGGGTQGIISYSFQLFTGMANVTQLFPDPNNQAQGQIFSAITIINDQIPTEPPVARALHYHFFSIDVQPFTNDPSGVFFVVNITRVSTQGTTLRLLYGDIPTAANDHGVLDVSDMDDCVWQYCIDTSQPSVFDYPLNTQPRIPCVCTPQPQDIGIGVQLTCNLTVDPCFFQNGTWYASVELPTRTSPYDSYDQSGIVSYILSTTLEQNTASQLSKNATYKAQVYPEAQANFMIQVPASDVSLGNTHLFVQVANVRGGYVDIWVHQGLSGYADDHAGGPEGCLPANATCHTRDACNIVIEKCHFSPGIWYIAVSVSQDNSGNFLIDDVDRLPITFTIRSTWINDPTPVALVSGVPVHSYIGEALYDFYVLQVPPTIDTMLYVELYAQANDTEVIVSMLHGALPGGECYATPDFYCFTGDNRDFGLQTGPPVNQIYTDVKRKSCTFMIQTCELVPGPLYISVYGQHTAYSVYGDNTYYQVPVHYTLYVDFDVPLSIESGVSLSENVFEGQYNHYYIRADQIDQGSYLTVEATNIQHGIPQSVEVFVNYNFLAGNCPCYDNLYNCTGAVESGCAASVAPMTTASPTDETVSTCCTVTVPPCAFRQGVWYISVLGVNENKARYSTPIGYTLTATIWPAPNVEPLLLGQPATGEAGQYNRSYSLSHFKLGASPIPLHDLVFQLTWVQNCNDYLSRHDRLADNITLLVSVNGVASSDCYDYTCSANIQGESYCTVVVPACEWIEADYFVAVRGDFISLNDARFTLKATIEQVYATELSSGVPVYGSVPNGRYRHYFFSVDQVDGNHDLLLELYTNSDQDAVTAYMNKDSLAGDLPCFSYQTICPTRSACFWQIPACELQLGNYYLSVFGDDHQFYDISVEHTVSATLERSVVAVQPNFPMTGHVQVGEMNQYVFIPSAANVAAGNYLKISIDNVQHGSVEVFYQFDSNAGACPCYSNSLSCITDSEATLYCEIDIPICEYIAGEYYISVVGLENKTPSPVPYNTAIGYTIEYQTLVQTISQPTVVRDRFSNYTLIGETLSNSHYNSYQFMVAQQDFDQGFHVVVEITNVYSGALQVFFSNDIPADINPLCQAAEICTSGLGTGSSCFWQIPYCLGTAGTHYITVYGVTGRTIAQYDILIWLERPVDEIPQNPTFTLDTLGGYSPDSLGTNNTIIHYSQDEPLGWVQFLELQNVSISDPMGGEILELFFYGVQNNAGESLGFKVYAYPEAPAGPHECCTDNATPSSIGNCENAPCSRTVPISTFDPSNIGEYGHSVNVAVDAIDLTPNFECLSGAIGVGSDPYLQDRYNNANGFYGSRCIARVWSCDILAVQQAGTSVSWWVTVVPDSAPNPNAIPLPGLTYQFQWRVRNVRIDPTTGSIGTFALDSTTNLNSSPFESQTFSLTNPTTESEQFASFSVTLDVADGNFHKLVIQTDFKTGSGGSGIVYIQEGSYANPMNCQMYACQNGALDCFNTYRFVVPQCCATSTTYYITVRNAGPVNSNIQFAFRVTDISTPPATMIPSDVTTTPYTSTGLNNNNQLGGLQGGNYDLYFIQVQQQYLNEYDSLVIQLTGASAGEIEMFVKFGAVAGDNTADSALYTGGEACFSWQESCVVQGVNQICTIQLDSCQLIAGEWYISVYNPNFDIPTSAYTVQQYSLTVYYVQSRTLTFGNTFTETNFQAGTGQNLLIQYVLNITEQDIAYLSQPPNDFFTSFVRITVSGIYEGYGFGGANLNVFISYGLPAGNSPQSECLSYFDNRPVCTSSTGCYFDILPCGGSSSTDANVSKFPLVVGTYFIGVEVTGTASYSITSQLYTNSYQLIPLLTTEDGTGNRVGTINSVYQVSSGYNSYAPDVDGDYRYYLTISNVQQNTYLLVNISSNEGITLSAPIHLTVWRDCEVYSCQITTAQGWCTIDALGLAPCSVESGTYYFRVSGAQNQAFTISVYQNQTTIQDIQNGQTITEIIYSEEYQAYFYEANIDFASTIAVTITPTCGTLEAWINRDVVGGPDAPINLNPQGCSLYHCVGTATSPCILTLDTCETSQRGYYVTIRGNSQTFPSSTDPNLDLPIRYDITVLQKNVTQIEIFKNCPVVVTYDEDYNINPFTYVINLERVKAFSTVRATLTLPSSIFFPVTAGNPTLHVKEFLPVGYTANCLDDFSCSIASGQTSCSVFINLCSEDAVIFNIFADAPHGSELLFEIDEPTVRSLHFGELRDGTVSATSAANLLVERPFAGNTQIYRLDFHVFEPNNDFFLTASLFGVNQGSVALTASFVNFFNNVDIPNALCEPNFVSTCAASDGEECNFVITLCDIKAAYGLDYRGTVTIYFQVTGLAQVCELHAINYSLLVTNTVERTPLETGNCFCSTLSPGSVDRYSVISKGVGLPQTSVINFEFTELTSGNSLGLYFNNDHFIPSSSCYDQSLQVSSAGTEIPFLCDYDDLQLAVYSSGDGETEYRICAYQMDMNVVTINDSQVYVVDKIPSDTCTHTNDVFYYQPIASSNATGYVTFNVTSEFPVTAYLSANFIGGSTCNIGTCSSTSSSASCVVSDFCNAIAPAYYLTVEAQGPYSVVAFTNTNITTLTLGNELDDSIAPGTHRVYKVVIDGNSAAAGSRLSVELYGISEGEVTMYIAESNIPDANCFFQDISISTAINSTNFGTVVVDSCNLFADTYYIHVAAPMQSICSNISYVLRAQVFNLDLPVQAININSMTSQSLNAYTGSYQSYFSVQTQLLNSTTFDLFKARLANVSGGFLNLLVMDQLSATPLSAVTQSNVQDLFTSASIFSGEPAQVAFPVPVINLFDPICAGCALSCCDTINSTSCIAMVDTCLAFSNTFYIAVELVAQFDPAVPVTFDLVVEEIFQPIQLGSNSHLIGNFTNRNIDFDVYSVSTVGQQSIRIRTQVINGAGVEIFVYDNCPEAAHFLRQAVCYGRDYEENFACDINILTRGYHPGPEATNLLIFVAGDNATYSISFFSGLENCDRFTDDGQSEGVNFCAGLVPYTFQHAENYTRLDNAASCLFEQLYNQFRVQPCWSGVTAECNATLQRFACYESFPRCDAEGFAVGTCRKACEAVVYECVNYFESVNLEHYNCTSERYLNEFDGPCTGNIESSFFNAIDGGFNANDLLYDFGAPYNASPSKFLSFSSVAFLLSIVVTFFFL